MFEKETKQPSVKLPLEARFKNSFNPEAKKKTAAKQVSSQNILVTAPLPVLLRNVSSVSEEAFNLDQVFNSELQLTSFRRLSEDFDKSEMKSLEAITYLSKESFALEAFLKELQTQQKKSDNKVLLNLFYRDEDLQFDTDSFFLYKDPSTNIIYNPRYRMEYYPFNGYSLPIMDSKVIPITDIIRDASESNVGQTIIEENDPEDLLNNFSYKVLFLDKDKDDDGFVYSRKESYYVGLWFNIGGIQPVNKIVFKTNINTSISSLVYLDQNENEVNISFSTFLSEGTTVVTFDKITAKSFKIIFETKTPIATTLYQSEHGRVYCFSIHSISFLLDQYGDTGYYLSRPMPIDNFLGCILSRTFAADSDFILETYLKVESFSANKNKTENIVVQLLPKYNEPCDFALYFLNKISKLNFIPSSDFVLYKNEKELVLGTDYFFFTSKDSTYLSTIPEIDINTVLQVYVVLAEYDFFSKYICTYTPLKGAFTPEGFKYANDSIYLLKKIPKTKTYFYSIIRQVKQGNMKLPILQNYTLELLNESK